MDNGLVLRLAGTYSASLGSSTWHSKEVCKGFKECQRQKQGHTHIGDLVVAMFLWSTAITLVFNPGYSKVVGQPVDQGTVCHHQQDCLDSLSSNKVFLSDSESSQPRKGGAGIQNCRSGKWYTAAGGIQTGNKGRSEKISFSNEPGHRINKPLHDLEMLWKEIIYRMNLDTHWGVMLIMKL